LVVGNCTTCNIVIKINPVNIIITNNIVGNRDPGGCPRNVDSGAGIFYSGIFDGDITPAVDIYPVARGAAGDIIAVAV
jgi:hypothetical protein